LLVVEGEVAGGVGFAGRIHTGNAGSAGSTSEGSGVG